MENPGNDKPKRFEKGGPAGPGRPPGLPSVRKTILRAAYVLAEKGISPTEKLIEIAEAKETPTSTRIELWKYLHSYVEAAQTAPSPLAPDSPEGSVANAQKVAEHLKELSRPLEPSSTKP